MPNLSEPPIGEGTTTLDYLKNAYPWLAEMIADLEARAERTEAVVEAARMAHNYPLDQVGEWGTINVEMRWTAKLHAALAAYDAGEG